MSKHTPGPWSQGFTLLTETTKQWTATQVAENDRKERRMVFSNFTPEDQGRGRRLVAVFEREEDAALGAAAPLLLEALISAEKTIHKIQAELPTSVQLARYLSGERALARKIIAKARGEA